MSQTPMPDSIYDWKKFMMTSSNENIFRATGPLCGESTGRRSPHKGQWRRAFMFSLICAWRLNKRLGKQSRRRLFETPSCSLWRHWNAIHTVCVSLFFVVNYRLILPISPIPGLLRGQYNNGVTATLGNMCKYVTWIQWKLMIHAKQN